jgi:RNA polymerase sigma-70 factor (ECF subfamily)
MRLARKVDASTGPSCLRAFETEVPFIVGWLRRHGVAPADTQDLAQEIFVIMWRHWAEYDQERPLRAWLAGIAHKVVARYNLRRQRFVAQERLEVRDPAPTPDEQVAAGQARGLLWRALDRLAPAQRTILVMHDLEEIPVRDVAAAEGVPLFTAYTRLRTARRNLAEAMTALQREGQRPPRSRLVVPMVVALAVAAAVLVVVRARVPDRRPPVAGRSAVARWSFDEPLLLGRDLTGNGNDCQLRGGGGPPTTAGVVGRALALDGRHWLECPAFDRGGRLQVQLTIALWIRLPPGSTGRQVLVTRQLGTSGDRLFSLRLQDGSVELLSHLWQRALRRPYPGAAAAWTHVAAVRDLDGTSLYVDGVLAGRNTHPRPALLRAGTPLLIGGQINGPEAGGAVQDTFRGDIDELAIYDRPLGADEIRALARP